MKSLKPEKQKQYFFCSDIKDSKTVFKYQIQYNLQREKYLNKYWL